MVYCIIVLQISFAGRYKKGKEDTNEKFEEVNRSVDTSHVILFRTYSICICRKLYPIAIGSELLQAARFNVTVSTDIILFHVDYAAPDLAVRQILTPQMH